MKRKIFSLIFALVLVLGFSLIPAVPMAHEVKASPETFTFPGGSLATTNLNPWGGVNVVVYPVAFNVDACPLTMTVYGLDMSGVNYGGDWGWPPDAGDLGAIAAAGMAGDPTPRFDMINGCWNQFSSSPGPGAKSWDGKPANHDNGYTKWFRQVWSSDMAGNKVNPDGPNHQYNVESRVVPNANHPAGGTGNPSDYCTFDLRIKLTPIGTKVYKMETWSRMHRAASNDEGCGWKWNTAIAPVPPQNPDPENAWAAGWPPGSWRTLTNNDFLAIFPFLSIANWGTQQTQYHTISWDGVVVEGCPTTPMVLKTEAKAELESIYPTGDKKVDQGLEKAMEHLDKSLDGGLWVNDTHLEAKHGKKVFDEEQKVVEELQKLIDKGDASPAVKAECLAVTGKLCLADGILAHTAYEEALANGGDPKELDKSNKELGKAGEEIGKGNCDKAIEHFKKAWEHAQKAMGNSPDPD